MAGVGVDDDFHLLAQLFQRLLELFCVFYGNATILPAENSENRSINLLLLLGIRGDMAVMDDRSSQCGFLERDIEGVASAHAPAD